MDIATHYHIIAGDFAKCTIATCYRETQYPTQEPIFHKVDRLAHALITAQRELIKSVVPKE